MKTDIEKVNEAAERLKSLYSRDFGGKPKGRFRIAVKLVRQMLGRKRIYESDVSALSRAMFERGFVIIDMDSYFIVLSANTFVNYRRANEECIG